MPGNLRLGGFTVDLAAGRLFKRGTRVPLRDQSFRVLAALLERPGDVITRDELRRRLWPQDIFVDFENNLNSAIARLREALGDSAGRPRFIETLPKRGYRLIAPVDGEPTGRAARTTRRRRILVLPFLNSTGDPHQEFLADAITDEIITALSSFAPDQLAVIARTTAMHYKGTHKHVTAIVGDLDLDFLVEGGVRRADDHLTLNIQLIRGSDQTHLWARSFDVDPGDVFPLQQVIAAALGEHLGLGRGAEGPAIEVRRPTEDLEAYTLFQRGRYHLFRGTPQEMAVAKQCFEQALVRDPRFALAYDALAELHWYLGFLGLVPARVVTATGLFYAMQALDVDDRLAETHALLGLFRKAHDFNWTDVRRQMERARELNPSSPTVRLRYAMGWLLPERRLGEAVTEIEAALETDPLSMFMRAWLGCMLWLNRQHQRAIEQSRLMIETEPNNYLGHWQLGLYSGDVGRHEQAIAALQRAVELSGGSPLVLGWLGFALARAGRRTDARDMLARLQAVEAGGAFVPPTSFAWTHLGLGEYEDAFSWLDRAVDGSDHMIMPIQSYPFLDGVRHHPRYLDLLRRLKMKPTGGVYTDA